MSYIAIAGFILCFALSAFGFNYRLSSINRVYFGLYKGVAESSVISVDAEGRDMGRPMLSKSLFEKNTANYLESNKMHIPEYEFTVYSYKGLQNNVEYATKIHLYVYFKVSFAKYYTKTAYFTIQKGQLEVVNE